MASPSQIDFAIPLVDNLDAVAFFELLFVLGLNDPRSRFRSGQIERRDKGHRRDKN
jgi:hypothetical protein